jgi:uncharacterized repeat protein (TIGR03803 family)
MAFIRGRDRESVRSNNPLSAFEQAGVEREYNVLARMHRYVRTLPSGEELFVTNLNWMTKACGVFLLWVTAAASLPAQTFTTLLDFSNGDGAGPGAALLQGTNGSFYGATEFGGPYLTMCLIGCGTLFEITPSGTLTTLYNFCSESNCADGYYPFGALVQDSNGDVYGTTEYGGTGSSCPAKGGCGTVFKITSTGARSTVYSFCSESNCDDGQVPYAGLIRGTDGNFYGTTSEGGLGYCANGCGTVFKITPGGTLTSLHSFDGTDGTTPFAALIQATNGDFYGTTYGGYGTVFKITPSGVLTTLRSFVRCDGWPPAGSLAQGSDRDFYGTMINGGPSIKSECPDGCGTIYKITPGGALETLHRFDSTDGSAPEAGLVLGTDGNFYGTTSGGGTTGEGTIFSITSSGTLTTLHNFGETDGYYPEALI